MKQMIKSFVRQVRCDPAKTLFFSIVLLVLALVLRLFCGGMRYFYDLCVRRGLFPGGIGYTLFYAARLTLCGMMLSGAVFDRTMREARKAALLFCGANAALLLSEYSMIFCAYRPGLAAVLADEERVADLQRAARHEQRRARAEALL